jgi:hypothetical protein
MLQIFTMPFLVGVLAAAVYVAVLRLLDSHLAQWLYAVGLLSAALIYVGFAGLNHGIAHMGLEGSGLLIFGALSVLGARRWPLLLGLGWLAHGGWDFWHAAHPSHYVPSWWPAFCVGYDWVVGIYILAFHLRKKPSVTAPAKYS